jgi:hypothetical protein
MQDRVEHVGVVDVVEDDRATIRRDAAREAPAHRDPHALLDLLLDSDCRARDELVRVRLEQEHRGRVDLEHRDRALEQRRQQLLELQRGQRRVGE